MSEQLKRQQAEQGKALDDLSQVLRYHQETKHHFFRYAHSVGFLDWANQPDPFRRYPGAPLIPLPILKADEEPLSPPYEHLYGPRPVARTPIALRALSRFFEYALALSAWKQVGEVRWALRSNPSSGNLHPTEGYLLIGGVPGLAPTPGLYHYAPKEHGLERRADWTQETFESLMKDFPPHAFLFGLSSVHWREAWKYGERAFRYCQHDAGHAIGTARIAAQTLGWRMMLLEGLSDDTIAVLLGLDRSKDFEGAEREHPDCIAVVWPTDGETATSSNSRGPLPLFLEQAEVNNLIPRSWHGQANRLSGDEPVRWEIIDLVADKSWKTSTDRKYVELKECGSAVQTSMNQSLSPGRLSAWQVIRQRRSALAFDGKTSITAASFFTMLERVMPRREQNVSLRPMPWDAISWDPTVHLALFVHRVDELPSGLYILVRDLAKLDTLRQALQDHFAWLSPPGCPDNLPLFLLQEGDLRQLAAQVSCHQDIAGEGAFSLGMIAEFEPVLRKQGPWFYRRLFWETGLIGQVLYLEAEAAGIRATGIGCFFDDPVHQVLGLKNTAFQSLYHFTTGGPVEDPRLTTLPPYGPAESTQSS
ncbi:MAG: SagB/ThcOx family dehydrogenase [Deltaproteobacteria bacterium]|nr:SagB/ThcOx family dehydrogenase [Deltaproteobacteria bacterium]